MATTLICLLFLAASPAASGDFELAEELYKAEQFDEAFSHMLPLAKAGDARAQFYVGLMYHGGQGTKRNLAKANKWIRQAAEQDNPDAQYNYGMLRLAEYASTRDRYFAIESQMWFILAADQGHPIAAKAREVGATQMSEQEIREAQKMADQWIKKRRATVD